MLRAVKFWETIINILKDDKLNLLANEMAQFEGITTGEKKLKKNA